MWRVVRHYVDATHAAQRWNEIRAVAIDETATRKGHRYATVVVEIDLELKREARLLFMTPERTAASVGQFVEAMEAHGASAPQVQVAAIDTVSYTHLQQGKDDGGPGFHYPVRLRQRG